MKAVFNPKTGTIDNPIYPCYKAEGLCKVREYPEREGLKFECSQEPKTCRYLKRIVGAKVTVISEPVYEGEIERKAKEKQGRLK